MAVVYLRRLREPSILRAGRDMVTLGGGGTVGLAGRTEAGRGIERRPGLRALTRAVVRAAVLGATWADAVGQAVDNRVARGDVPALVDRATAVVDRFFRDFGSMVAEERYEQRFRGALPRSGRVRTVLVSDFLLVEVPGEGRLPFRDVFERDGKPVRDRQARLVDLFLRQDRNALEQAYAIANESARYNIGGVQRTINVPTLALAFLASEYRHRFAFTLDGRSDGAVVIAYEEKTRPTIVRDGRGDDLPVKGRFWFDERNLAVVRTELRAVGSLLESRITVTYVHDPTLNMWVPARMEERYLRNGTPGDIWGEATYSKFRRFQVSTTQELAR